MKGVYLANFGAKTTEILVASATISELNQPVKQIKIGVKRQIDATDFKAGERVYVGNPTSPISHLPAEPTAQGIFALLPLRKSVCR